MGRPLTFHYKVKLGPRAEGYPIQEQRCAPAEGDTGYTQMCQYLENPERMMTAIEREKPLARATVECGVVLATRSLRRWLLLRIPSRDHKWGLVLETIHYALVQMELAQDAEPSMKKLLQDAMRERPMLSDGAMGTQLMIAGLEQGNCGEEWNLTHPERVLAIQRRYAEAGSECILTNTFGGSRIMLNRHPKADIVVEINKAGVEIVRQAFDGKEGYIIGDIGPFGGLLEPYGEFTEAQVQQRLRGTGRGAGGGGS